MICIQTRSSRQTPLVIAIAAVLLTIAGGCDRGSEANSSGGGAPAARGDQRLHAIATTGMIADIVRNVAGDRMTVRALMGAGVDPHLYRPTRADLADLLAADIIFYNGLNLEGKMSDTFVKVARTGKPVFAASEQLPEEFLLSPDDFEGHHDPHVWMDPNGWMLATEAVARGLIEFDSPNAEAYQRNADVFMRDLKRLDDYARARLATIPDARRILVTAHDAFHYFARAYDLEVLGIQGISTDSEAGLQKIESLVSTIVERRIPAVFTESSVSEKNIRALVEGAQSRGHDLKIGGELFSDAMGAEGTYEGTYVGMLDHNITTIVRALGGDAPAGGMNGRLKTGKGGRS